MGMDILQTGKYGILAHQKLLATTSNNISNVNTTGYTRQDTLVYTNVVDWGIGDTYTRRIYNQYVQREMFRDQGNVGYYDSYTNAMSQVDQMLSDEDMSISSSLNSYFSALQDAIQSPTSSATRRELLSQLNLMVNKYQTLNKNIQNELKDVNSQVDDTVVKINTIVKGIYDVEKQLRTTKDDSNDMQLQLMDKRDQLINELSSYVDINTTIESDGSISVYMGNGQLLVNGETYANLHSNDNELDPQRKEISITFEPKNINDKTNIQVSYDNWGGKLGGLLQSTNEIRQSMRDLGQLALAFADAMNVQNKSGFTLEGKAGGNLITIPSEVKATSTNSNFAMSVTFIEGEGKNISANDFKVEFDRATGAPTVYEIVDGKAQKVDITAANISADQNGNLVISLPDKGINMNFNFPQTDLNKVAGTTFLVQPTINAAYDIKTNITKPEDFAFAAAVRTNTSTNNVGNAVVSLSSMTKTGADMGVSIDPNTNMPVFNAGAPTKVVVDNDGNYVIYDSNGNRLGQADADTNGQNIFANATWDVAKPEGYPGYDINVTGTVKANDSFVIEINTDGSGDNTNGIYMGQLQQAALVGTDSSHKLTFTEGYADLVSTLGAAVMEAQTSLDAAQVKCTQTQELFSSSAGVNLDEEAANLVKFQQSYSSCAKIITASQTIFDSLINAF